MDDKTTSIYDELYQKAQSGQLITTDDLRLLAQFDPVVWHFLTRCDVDMWSITDALKACVCVLAAHSNTHRGELVKCYERHGTMRAVTVVDRDGKILASLSS